MNISELASLVTVRNHIYTVINDKSVTKREDYRPLDEKRRELDLKFVQVLLDSEIEGLVPNETTLVKVGGDPTLQDLEVWRSLFEQAKADPNFTIFTGDNVDVSKVDTSKVEISAKGVQLVSEQSDSKQLDLFEGEAPVKSTKKKTTKKTEKSVKQEVKGQIAKSTSEEVEKLKSEGVQLESSIVHQDAQLLLEEKKAEAAKKASSDPDIASAIARQKEALKKEGRSNRKVEKANGTTG